MKKVLLIAAAFLVALGVAQPPAAEARVFVGVGVGGGCCYGYGYPYYHYPAYYYPYYVAPPPVVYAVPPAPPVVYSAPPAPIAAPVVAAAPAPTVEANQTSPTFIDSQGRTCRHYQATSAGGPPYGTACLQPDGSWRAVQ